MTVHEIDYNGAPRWEVRDYAGGKETRRRFKHRRDADAFVRGRQGERQEAVNLLSGVSPVRQAEIVRCLDMCSQGGFELAQAVDHYVRYLADRPSTTLSLEEAFDAYIDSRYKAGLQDVSIKSLRWILGRFLDAHQGAKLADVDKAMLQAYLDNHLSQASVCLWNKTITVLGQFLNWHRKQGHVNANAAETLEKRKQNAAEVEVYSTGEVEDLLRAALETDRGMCARLAVQAFAGLRTAEVDDPARFSWDRIDLESAELSVIGKVKRQRRIVKMSDNLVAWLRACEGSDLGQVNYKRRIKDVFDRSGVRPIHNGLRHTAASNHVAYHDDAGKTAMMLGHSGNLTMLYNHYRAVVRPSDARRYWEIRP
jgi:site-specific recombinase XerD